MANGAAGNDLQVIMNAEGSPLIPVCAQAVSVICFVEVALNFAYYSFPL